MVLDYSIDVIKETRAINKDYIGSTFVYSLFVRQPQ